MSDMPIKGLTALLITGVILAAAAVNISYAQPPGNGGDLHYKDIHGRPGSKCDICHPVTVDIDKAAVFLKSDLCISCHEKAAVMMSRFRMKSSIQQMDNHPIKFSPFDYDPRKINRTIIKDGENYRILGRFGALPLFGDSRDTAVAECATCHDPHGTGGFDNLLRIDNRASRLCRICHIDL